MPEGNLHFLQTRIASLPHIKTTCRIKRSRKILGFTISESVDGNDYHSCPKDEVKNEAEAVSAPPLLNWTFGNRLIQNFPLVVGVLFTILIAFLDQFVVHLVGQQNDYYIS